MGSPYSRSCYSPRGGMPELRMIRPWPLPRFAWAAIAALIDRARPYDAIANVLVLALRRNGAAWTRSRGVNFRPALTPHRNVLADVANSTRAVSYVGVTDSTCPGEGDPANGYDRIPQEDWQ